MAEQAYSVTDNSGGFTGRGWRVSGPDGFEVFADEARDLAEQICAAKNSAHKARDAEIRAAKGNSWSAWMVEREHEGSVQYLTIGDLGYAEWTTDPLIGLHFVRREDAERFARECEDASAIREHEFVGPKAP